MSQRRKRKDDLSGLVMMDGEGAEYVDAFSLEGRKTAMLAGAIASRGQHHNTSPHS